MPLYEYECKQCHQRLEKIQSFSAPHETVCPKCGGVLERVISAPAIQFKGAGWYVNDYAKSGGKTKTAESSDGKAESKSEGASDSKSEAKNEGTGGNKPASDSSAASSSDKPAPSSTTAATSSGGSGGAGSSSTKSSDS